ncbi:MAG: hypothetical protein KAX26_06475, partial [Anaerolineae bacterium]|nr:hypothetical protein [Anaerolineae bacterium]
PHIGRKLTSGQHQHFHLWDGPVALDEQAAQVTIGAEEEFGFLDGGNAGDELQRAGHCTALDSVGGLLQVGAGRDGGGRGEDRARLPGAGGRRGG